MTLFSKPKHDQPAVPERCMRCGARLGTTRLGFSVAGDAPLSPDERLAWLCTPCQRDARREGADN